MSIGLSSNDNLQLNMEPVNIDFQMEREQPKKNQLSIEGLPPAESMSDWLLATYDGKVFEYGDMMMAYKSVVKSFGYESSEYSNWDYLFRKAKKILEKEGLIQSIKFGTYCISKKGVHDTEDPSQIQQRIMEEAVDDDTDEATDDYVEDTTITIGSGEGEVYLYYYSTYFKLAKLEGEEMFPCKIGKTTKGHEVRFKGNTDVPEKRTLGLAIYTDEPDVVESMIHLLLRHDGRQIDTYGKEWFYTNPQEVEKLYKGMFSVLKESFEQANPDMEEEC